MRVCGGVLGVVMGACSYAAACGQGAGGTAGVRPDAVVTFPEPGPVLDENADDGKDADIGPGTDDGEDRGDTLDAGDEAAGRHMVAGDPFLDAADVAAEDARDPGHGVPDADPGAPDVGCVVDDDCPVGQWCDAPKCRPCDIAAHCGPECLECGAGLQCWAGECVECVAGADCGPGRWCDAGTCVPCAEDDPAHCGADCEPCLGERPACAAGACVCTETSCGIGRRCRDGTCEACDKAEACGPECRSCEAPTPHCLSASAGCVQCLDASHCGADETCLGAVCVSVCATVQGCASDEGPDGKTCGTGKVIGRTAALVGYVHNGDTTNDKNNDDLSFPIFQDKVECWDANEDNFFRLYVLAGDRLDATLTPKDPMFDSMMKIYRGITCKAGGDPYECFNSGSDGKPDVIQGWTAPADGWITLVVDGRSAFDEEGDWGPYSLQVTLTCLRPDCCCPARW